MPHIIRLSSTAMARPARIFMKEIKILPMPRVIGAEIGISEESKPFILLEGAIMGYRPSLDVLTA